MRSGNANWAEKLSLVFSSGLSEFRLQEFSVKSQISDREYTVQHLQKEIRDSLSEQSKAKWRCDIERVEKRKETLIKRLADDETYLVNGLTHFFKESMQRIKDSIQNKKKETESKQQPATLTFLDWGSGFLYPDDEKGYCKVVQKTYKDGKYWGEWSTTINGPHGRGLFISDDGEILIGFFDEGEQAYEGEYVRIWTEDGVFNVGKQVEINGQLHDRWTSYQHGEAPATHYTVDGEEQQ